MKKQNFFSSLLVSAVALTIAVPSLVNADPAGSPPGGNVDANFNTVTATGGYFVQADITNWFYNSGGHYGGSVAVNDPNGFISTGTSRVAGTFQGGTKGVDGSCNVAACAAGYFSATGAGGVGVSASSTNGVAGTFNGTNGGVSVTTTNFNAGDFTTFDPSSYALISSGSNNFRGKILNTDASVNGGRVQISDDDGFRIANTAGTAQFDVSGTTGDISDPNGDVTVSDEFQVSGGFSKSDVGFRLNSASATFTVEQIGSMTRMYDNTTQPLQILDADGLDVRGYIRNGGIISDSNPVKIAEPDGLLVTSIGGTQGLTVSSAGDIADTNSDVMVADNLQSTGYISSGWDGTGTDTTFAAIYNNGAMYGTGAIWNSPTAGGLTLNAISPGGMTLNSCLNHTDTAPVNGQCDTISGNAGFTINTQSGGQTINATTGGFTVNATSGGIALNSDTGGIANQKAGLPVRIQDNMEVSGSIQTIGNHDLRTWLYDGADWVIDIFGDVNATGAITGNSVGTYYEYENPVSAYRSGGAWYNCDAYPGTNICEKRANCQNHAGTADIPIHASVSNIIGGGANAYLVQIGVNHPSATDAQYYYYSSNAASPTGLRIKVLCFSPDGD